MRVCILLLALSALSACGPSAKETPREPHGGEQANDGSGNDAKVACTTPQLTLSGVVAKLKYERTVKCTDVLGSGLETVDDRPSLSIQAQDLGRGMYLTMLFRDAFGDGPFSGAVQIVLRIPDDAVLGNCPSEEYPSEGHYKDGATGSFDLVDLHYMNADGSCAEAVSGSIHGSWTLKP